MSNLSPPFIHNKSLNLQHWFNIDQNFFGAPISMLINVTFHKLQSDAYCFPQLNILTNPFNLIHQHTPNNSTHEEAFKPWIFHFPKDFPQSQYDLVNPSKPNISALRASLSHNPPNHLTGLHNMRNLTSPSSWGVLIISLEIPKTQLPSRMC